MADRRAPWWPSTTRPCAPSARARTSPPVPASGLSSRRRTRPPGRCSSRKPELLVRPTGRGHAGGVIDEHVAAFRAARDLLLEHRDDYAAARREFRWPRLTEFNWARDWFDGVLAVEHADATALWIVEEDGFEE